MANEDLAPKLGIKIAGTEFGEAAIEYVTACTVSLALDKADQITLQIANPIKDEVGKARSSELVFTDSLAFMPGNVVEVFMGYGNKADTFIAAGIVRKHMPVFPGSGMPTLTIQALDGSCVMMDGSDILNATAARVMAQSDTGGFTLSEMAKVVISEYGIGVDGVEDVDTEPAVPTVKKAGMSDYAFVKGIANLVGFEFYVYWDPDAGSWEARWQAPTPDDEYKSVFTWGPDFASAGEGGVLIEFAPEFAVQGASTDVELYYFDRDTKTWEQVVYPETQNEAGKQEFEWAGDETTVDADLAEASDPETGMGLRIKASGFSVEVVPTQNFGSQEEALAWAEAWWKARQSMLIQGRGRTIGFPNMRPGQVHTFNGLGAGLSGDWYIVEVEHQFKRGSGYICDFFARKVIP